MLTPFFLGRRLAPLLCEDDCDRLNADAEADMAADELKMGLGF